MRASVRSHRRSYSRAHNGACMSDGWLLVSNCRLPFSEVRLSKRRRVGAITGRVLLGRGCRPFWPVLKSFPQFKESLPCSASPPSPRCVESTPTGTSEAASRKLSPGISLRASSPSTTRWYGSRLGTVGYFANLTRRGYENESFEEFRTQVRPEFAGRIAHITWQDLFVIAGLSGGRLLTLQEYLLTKTANLIPAFNFGLW